MGKVRDGLRARIAGLVQFLSLGVLTVLCFMLPSWRHLVLYHRPPEAVFFEGRDFILYASDIAWWLVVVLWLLSLLLRPPRGHWSIGPWFLFGPLLGLFVLALVGMHQAVDSEYARYQVLRLFLLLVLYVVLVNMPDMPAVVAWPLAMGTVLEAVVGLPQLVLGHSAGFYKLGEMRLWASWPGTSVVMVGEERLLRAHGLTQHPNLLGGCLMVFLLVIVGYYLGQSGWQRLPLLIVLELGLFTLLATFSRAAWLGMVCGGLVVLGLLAVSQEKRTLHWPSVLLLVVVATGVIISFVAVYRPFLEPRLGLVTQGAEIRSVEERSSLVRGARALIEQRPVLGVGLGNFATALYRLAPETIADYPIYQPVHNVVLLTMAELGLLGGVLWLCLLISPWAALWVGRQHIQFSPWLIGLSGAMAGLAVVSWFDYYVWNAQQGRLLLILVYGLWAREWMRQKRNGVVS